METAVLNRCGSHAQKTTCWPMGSSQEFLGQTSEESRVLPGRGEECSELGILIANGTRWSPLEPRTLGLEILLAATLQSQGQTGH